jgi:hypothetical protein
MYPAHWLTLYPATPRDNRVFVAMSFDARLNARWSDVIEPALSSVQFRGNALSPYRVDTRQIGDSILTEIVQGVAQSRLVFVDITSLDELNSTPIRNGNVMYELGIAHAARLPEEILVFRSDDHPLPFDTQGFRTLVYHPEKDPKAAIETIGKAARDALSEIDLRRSAATRRVSERLSGDDIEILFRSSVGFPHPTAENTFAQAWAARDSASIHRLLEFGLVAPSFPKKDELRARVHERLGSLVTYSITEFGRAVARYITSTIGLSREEILDAGRGSKPVRDAEVQNPADSP